MKSLRRLLSITVLMLVLTCSAFAGEMGTGIVQPPPQSSATAAGEMGTGLAATNGTTAGDMSTSVDPVREVVLNLLRSVLSLF